MLAQRLPGLLPPLSPTELLETSMVHSVAGLIAKGALTRARPFRAPHHSASMAALTGGGVKVKPGEVSLAHNGVLFLDELPEFPRAALEALRQPVEAGRTTVARASAHITYPARFQMIAAMNPCRCGHFGDASRECGRAPRCAQDYQGKISGPLLDRIDLVVEVSPISPVELSRAPPGEGSAAVAARVATARAAQMGRAGSAGQSGCLNSEAELDRFCLVPEARALAETAAEKLGLSARGFTRMLRVSQTIADLARAPAIRRVDVAEALVYRHRSPGQPSLRQARS
jgi:magnesium chelatase family protein